MFLILLCKFHLYSLETIHISIISKVTLSRNGEDLIVDPTEYRSMIDALYYSTMSLFMHAPRIHHLHHVKRIFKYLQGTSTLGLQSSSKEVFLLPFVIAYFDVD